MADSCSATLSDGRSCPLTCWRPHEDYGVHTGLVSEPEFAKTPYCKLHLFKENAPPIYLTAGQIRLLHEYSTTLPTGTTIGKIWKRRNYNAGMPTWWLGEYVEHWDPGFIGMVWRDIIEDPLDTFIGPRSFKNPAERYIGLGHLYGRPVKHPL